MLTAKTIQNLKPADKTVTVSDGGGLQFRVIPTGGKYWRLAYRFNGQQKSLHLGPFPEISLAEARRRRDDAKRLLADGTDPSAARQETAEAAMLQARSTFSATVTDYLQKLRDEGRADVTVYKNQWILGLATNDLGSKQLIDIKAQDILKVLKAVEARGQRETARRLRGTIGSVFRFGAANGRCEADPTGLLKGALAKPIVKSRAAIIDPSQYGGLLRAIWSYSGQAETAAALKLLCLLVPRPGELRQAEWSEFDLAKAEWTVPASRMKMRRLHRCPLPRQAIEILHALKEISRSSVLVFPGTRSATRPISEVTTNAALRRMGFSKDEATSHGFRASFSTLANESGHWHPDAIERQLAHVEGNAVRAAYARGEHWEERVRLMQWWADQVDALRGGL